MELMALISDSQTPEQATDYLEDEIDGTSIGDLITKYAKQAELSIPEVFSQANIEKSMGYKILSGKRLGSRDSLLRMAFVLRMDLKNVQLLLTLGKRSVLYPRHRRDCLLIYAITHGETLTQVTDLLQNMGEDTLWRSVPEN